MFKPLGIPEFVRVCEEGHRGSKCCVEVHCGFTAFSQRSLQFGPFALGLLDALLVSSEERIAVGIERALDQLVDLLLRISQLGAQAGLTLIGCIDSALPKRTHDLV
ncbi:hypothetical protein AAJ72_08435 [Citromicrobium sp. RCC1885]|nr:hypothetical protein AAJ72_08435 [Citromicrobium sp. RCC1885]KPM28884.1 hypothetical protein AAJ74_09175 [Citromicrobium sp. RCC1878]OAM09564.1 hypothetical protein A0U43_00255 [Citromicrobium sp. RCC1897]